MVSFEIFNGVDWVPPFISKSYEASRTPPDNTSILWVDTTDTPTLKFFNNATGEWEPLK